MDELALAEAELDEAVIAMQQATVGFISAWCDFERNYGLISVPRDDPRRLPVTKASDAQLKAMKRRDLALDRLHKTRERLADEAHAALPTVWERLDENPF